MRTFSYFGTSMPLAREDLPTSSALTASGWDAFISFSRSGLVCPGDGSRIAEGYGFMRANRARWPIATMARLLRVSTSGYYGWLTREPSAHARSDAQLLARIRTVHASSRGTYGAPRIHVQLRRDGVHVGRKRVARLMRMDGLCGATRRRWKLTTHQRAGARRAPDLVRRHFSAAAPNVLWVADATYIPTGEGFLYLAVVLDVFSRRIVGWAMSNHLYTELMLRALDMALSQRRPVGVIHHSDQGCQGEFNRTPLPRGRRAAIDGDGRRRL
ncbi:IS3 family transposase [Paraburkholderia phytofirmans]|uniref:IS3 family transposase n=1 Tax=Paraburkholderia phytofirmans TaxID=261302 RepID=UPI0009EED1C6